MDLISRQAVINLLMECGKFSLCAMVNDNIPSAENKGEWIFDDECHEHGHCSKCGYGKVDLVDGKIHNFCPDCGADMRGSVKSFYDRMTEELGENWDTPVDTREVSE